MSWNEITCLCIIIIGVALFLYGSNSYNATVGWVGVYLMFGGILAEIILKVYGDIIKRKR
ncbi:MAG: hypothetical protein ACUVQX_04855 [Candidatus Bathycorpusculaceae bacterium]